MTEAIMISIFLGLLLLFQLIEQRKIIVKAKRNPVRLVITLLVAIGLLFLFWQEERALQIKLIVFVLLILSQGFVQEGLAHDHLVRLGVMTGDYTRYQTIQLERVRKNDETIVTFHTPKGNRTTLNFQEEVSDLKDYFTNLGLGDRLVVGEMPKKDKAPQSTSSVESLK